MSEVVEKKPAKLNTAMLGVALVSTLVGGTFGFLGGIVGGAVIDEKNESSISNVLKQDVQVVNEDSDLTKVIEESSISVVSIVISQDVPIYENDVFDPFTDDYFDYFDEREQIGSEEQQVGAGSGFIISEEGLVVTNRHVVDATDASYTVILNDGTKYDAKVLERDTLLDIALVQIESEDEFTPLKLGSSSELKVGQRVIAIGNALGEFSNSVTSGIVSGLSRDIIASDSIGRSSEQLRGVIQTDAGINPGNSGGPLLDIKGNVIGVNVAVANNAENIGFAIPVDAVRELLDRYEKTGSIERPILGVRYQLINEEIQEEEDLLVDYGALVVGGNRRSEQAVVAGSPADKAGLKAGDIILEIDGKKITEDEPLFEMVQNKFIGDEITIKYLRDGEEKEIKVKLEKISEEE